MNRVLEPALIEALREVDSLVDILINDHSDTVFDLASAIKKAIAPHIEASSNVIIFKDDFYVREDRDEWLNRIMQQEMYYESPELGENRDW